MSDTYTKLFRSITASSVWGEPHSTRSVWTTMLAHCDADGCVYASVPGLARIANATREETETALRSFLAPDHDSRTKEHEGRRIEVVDGGWRLLNHAKFAAVRTAAERAEYKRNWDREHRPSGGSRGKQSDTSPTESDTSPTKPDSPTPLALALDPAKSKEQKQDQKHGRAARALPDWLPPDAWAEWERYRRSRKGWTPKAADLCLRTLSKLRDEGHDPRAVIEQAIERGWTGLFPLRGNELARAGPGPPNGVRPNSVMSGVMRMEAMKRELASRGDSDGVPEAAAPAAGQLAVDRR